MRPFLLHKRTLNKEKVRPEMRLFVCQDKQMGFGGIKYIDHLFLSTYYEADSKVSHFAPPS